MQAQDCAAHRGILLPVPHSPSPILNGPQGSLSFRALPFPGLRTPARSRKVSRAARHLQALEPSPRGSHTHFFCPGIPGIKRSLVAGGTTGGSLSILLAVALLFYCWHQRKPGLCSLLPFANLHNLSLPQIPHSLQPWKLPHYHSPPHHPSANRRAHMLSSKGCFLNRCLV